MTAFVESRLALLYEKHPWLRKDPEPGAGRIQNMDAFDALPITLKQCVHEYGFPIVAILFKFGIKNPAHVHAIVREIWDGPRGFNTGSSRNGQTGPSATVDFLLEKSGSDLHAATLARALWERGFAIVPRDPTIGMVEASKATVSNFDQGRHEIRKAQKASSRCDRAVCFGVLAFVVSFHRQAPEAESMTISAVEATRNIDREDAIGGAGEPFDPREKPEWPFGNPVPNNTWASPQNTWAPPQTCVVDDAPPPGMHRVLRPVLVPNDPPETFVTDRPPSNRSMGEAILGQHTKLDEAHHDAYRAVSRAIERGGRKASEPTEADSIAVLAVRDLLAGVQARQQ